MARKKTRPAKTFIYYNFNKMEAEKLQRLHDTLAKLAPKGKIGGLGAIGFVGSRKGSGRDPVN